MDKKLAKEIFTLQIEMQRIENRKWEIQKQMQGESFAVPSWNDVQLEAMKFLMEKNNVNA